MRKFLRQNSLSLVMFGLFLLFLVGQAFAGYQEDKDERRAHGEPPLALGSYLVSGHFLEAVFENWESEFFQMAAYVLLTGFLFQKGSAESNDPNDPKPPRAPRGGRSPFPVRKGGAVLKWYEHSLSLALFSLFAVSFGGHLIAGRVHHNLERAKHGESSMSLLAYLTSSRFWFESFQNWQSEFLAVLAIVVLSIWLREKGSPESKAVASPHSRTGK